MPSRMVSVLMMTVKNGGVFNRTSPSSLILASSDCSSPKFMSFALPVPPVAFLSASRSRGTSVGSSDVSSRKPSLRRLSEMRSRSLFCRPKTRPMRPYLSSAVTSAMLPKSMKARPPSGVRSRLPLCGSA